MNWTVRQVAWAGVATGSALLAGLATATAIADRRGSEFFEEGNVWFFSHIVGGSVVMYTVLAVFILVFARERPDEPRSQRWKRAGWSLLGFVGYVVALNVLIPIFAGWAS